MGYGQRDRDKRIEVKGTEVKGIEVKGVNPRTRGFQNATGQNCAPLTAKL